MDKLNGILKKVTNYFDEKEVEKKTAEAIASTYVKAINNFEKYSDEKNLKELFADSSKDPKIKEKVYQEAKNELSELAKDDDDKLNAREEKNLLTKVKKNWDKLWKKQEVQTEKNLVEKTFMSKYFKKFNKKQIANINSAIKRALDTLNEGNLTAFFQMPVIRYILYHSVFSKFQKTFISKANDIAQLLMQLENTTTGVVRLGKTLGSKVRSELYKEGSKDRINAWFTILVGPAYRAKSANIKKITDDTVKHLNSVTDKLQKHYQKSRTFNGNFSNVTSVCKNKNSVINTLNEKYGLNADYFLLGFVTGNDGITALGNMLHECNKFGKVDFLKSIKKDKNKSIENVRNEIDEQIKKLESELIKDENNNNNNNEHLRRSSSFKYKEGENENENKEEDNKN